MGGGRAARRTLTQHCSLPLEPAVRVYGLELGVRGVGVGFRVLGVGLGAWVSGSGIKVELFLGVLEPSGTTERVRITFSRTPNPPRVERLFPSLSHRKGS